MRKSLLTVLLLASLLAGAQTLIINRQMYDYTVGDTIQWSKPYSLCWEPSSNEERVILGKQEIAGAVIYTVKDTRKYVCGSCAWGDKIKVHDIRINDLDATILFVDALDFKNDFYHVRTDTLYQDASLGNRYVYGWNYYLIPGQPIPDSVGSRMEGRTLFVQGIGEVLKVRVVSNGDPCFFEKKLEFYHKVGEAPYGTRVIVPPSLPSPPDKLKVYPTLIADQVVHIDYQGEGALQLQVVASDGRVVQEESLESGSNLLSFA